MICRPHVAVIAFVVPILFLSIAPATFAYPPSERVEESMQRAKKWLYDHQKDGTWEIVPKRQGDYGFQYNTGQWGGLTAIATYALLASGENPQDERLVKPIEFLKTADIIGTYALAMRTQVWLQLPQTPETRSLMKKDAQLLLKFVKTIPAARGFYDYTYTPTTGTYSCSRSQYGVLGIWAAEQAGVEIPDAYWKMVDEAWTKAQTPEGSWGYTTGNAPTPGMTAAGIATLYIIQDYTNPTQGLKCTGNLRNPAIEKGMAWMAKHMDGIAPKERYGADFAFTSLYTFERMSLTGGRKYIGGVDWYDKGANWLLDRQDSDGSWSKSDGGFNGGAEMAGTIDTSLAILFLERGHAPVMLNKVEYENIATGNKGPAWNQRPRDAANLARWVGRAAERWLNWQSVDLKAAPVEELHDAPILYVAGTGQTTWADADIEKLRRFSEQGGIILGNADCADRNFAESFRKLGEKMFPEYKWRALPATHMLFGGEIFNGKGRAPMQVLGLSNGVRELMLIAPSADLGKSWQQRDEKGGRPSYEFGANVYAYATSKAFGNRRRETHLVQADPAIKTERTIKLARLKYDGNWDPEPGGWRRLAAVMHNTRGVELTVTPVIPGKDSLDGFAFAHLTGTDALKFDDAIRKTLKSFVDAGGTLLIDAAGGATAFAQSAEAELRIIWPEAAPAGLQSPLKPDDALFGGKDNHLPTPLYRPFARATLGRVNTPRVRAILIKNRPAILLSAEDLSAGLVGQPVDGIVGYSPEAATEIVARILLPGSGSTTKPTTTTSKPTTVPH
jgi:hypothetical protein